MCLFADWDLLPRVDDALTAMARGKEIELPTGHDSRARQVRAERVQELLHTGEVDPTEGERKLPPALRELSDRLFSDAKTTACIRKNAEPWVRRHRREITPDDLTHDVFNRLFYVVVQNAGNWFRLRGRDPDATWWGWVYLQIPEVTDRAAKKLLRPPHEHLEGDLPAGPDRETGPRLDSLAHDRNKLPPELASDHEDVERLRDALDLLPADQRQAVVLRFVEENTWEQIAKSLEGSNYSVKQLVDRGLITLRRLLGGIEP